MNEERPERSRSGETMWEREGNRFLRNWKKIVEGKIKLKEHHNVEDKRKNQNLEGRLKGNHEFEEIKYTRE